MEKIIYEGGIPFTALWIGRGGFILFSWISALIGSFQNRLKITNERFEYSHGIFTRVNETIELYRVKDANFQQGFLARLFNVGYITLYASDTTVKNITFPFNNPKELVERLRTEVRSQRQEMRVQTTERL